MGYATTKFVHTVDPNLLCGICSYVLDNPVLTPCGHSFCSVCLDTWLSKPATSTCPECRSLVLPSSSKAVHSLRNFINGLDVVCDNNQRGCKLVLKLDRLGSHLKICGFAEQQCLTCQQVFNRSDLHHHQVVCNKHMQMKKTQCPEKDNLRSNMVPRCYQDSIVEKQLLAKMADLEKEVEDLHRDIHISESRNRVLEREYRKVKDELKELHNSVCIQFLDVDPNYDYGHSPSTIAELSFLIATYLHKKPHHVDQENIFACIRRSYESFARCGSSSLENDVQMLVSTAFASNWFDESQRISLNCWLQSISRYRYICRSNTSLSPIQAYRKLNSND